MADAVPLILSKYERARLIGIRAQMIQFGAPSLLPTGATSPCPIATARAEVDSNVLPVSLRRDTQLGSEYFIQQPKEDAAARYAPRRQPQQTMEWRAERPAAGGDSSE